jgi:opacity protein-like surface antigen
MQFKMRNLMLLAIIAMALMTNEAKSQSASPIHIGLKGGADFSSLSLSKNGLTSKYSPGYHAGLFTRVDISSLYVQGELLYASKKSKVETGLAGSQQVKWNSIEVPVLVGIKLLQQDHLNLRIFGGGVYSYVLNDKSSILQEVSQSFKKFDKSNIGYQAGAGVDFGRLSLDLKYEGALTNISKEFKSRPSSFQASVGFMIF